MARLAQMEDLEQWQSAIQIFRVLVKVLGKHWGG